MRREGGGQERGMIPGRGSPIKEHRSARSIFQGSKKSAALESLRVFRVSKRDLSDIELKKVDVS